MIIIILLQLLLLQALFWVWLFLLLISCLCANNLNYEPPSFICVCDMLLMPFFFFFFFLSFCVFLYSVLVCSWTTAYDEAPLSPSALRPGFWRRWFSLLMPLTKSSTSLHTNTNLVLIFFHLILFLNHF